IELAQRRVKMEALAASLPSSAPWRGLTTEISASKKALDAGRRLREAVVRLSVFTGEPDQTLASLAQALCDTRESLEVGGPTAEAAREYEKAHRAFSACLDRFRSMSGARESATKDLGTLFKSATAVVEREPRLRVWCDWIALSREAKEAGLGCLVKALETGAIAPDQTVE